MAKPSESIPWIQQSTTWIGSAKELHLRILLQDAKWAWTYPPRLWMWAGVNKPNGRIEGPGCAEMIAMAAGWEGKAQPFVEALVTARLLDETSSGYAIHDWMDFAGRFLEKREATRQRLRAFRERQRNKKVTRTKRVRNANVRPEEVEVEVEVEVEDQKKHVAAQALDRSSAAGRSEAPTRKLVEVAPDHWEVVDA